MTLLWQALGFSSPRNVASFSGSLALKSSCARDSATGRVRGLRRVLVRGSEVSAMRGQAECFELSR